MKIHEYQAKEIFLRYNIPVLESVVVLTAEKAETAAERIGRKVVIKAQVLAGGRGKAGGIKLAENPREAYIYAKNILEMPIKDYKVEKIMVAEAIEIQEEYYIGFTIDRRTRKIVCMASREGGVNIEEIAVDSPEKIIKEHINPVLGIRDFQLRRLSSFLFDEKVFQKRVEKIIASLYRIFVSEDCSLAEINPLILSKNNHLIALDSKINFDDNALNRHPSFISLMDTKYEDLDEIEAARNGLVFIKLEGNIGCIVNGAGLAMATMDVIKLSGGKPANFLDVGGSSRPEKIVKAFELILKNQKVDRILVNIFGGITRCDDIAEGLILASKTISINVPIVIRLTGNNEEIASEKLKKYGFYIFSSLEDAVYKVLNIK